MPIEQPTVGDPAEPQGDRSDAALGGNASRAVISGAVARGASYGASMALLAIAFAFATRALGPAAFGELIVVISIAAVAQILGDQALQTVGQRMLVEASASERPELAARLAGARLAIMPIVIVGAVLFGLLAGYRPEMIGAIALAGSSTLLVTLGGAYQTPMSIELRVGTASLVDLIRHVVIAAGLLTAVALGASLLGYVTVYIVAGAVHLACAVVLVGKRWRHLSFPTVSQLRPILREISWLALAIAVSSLFLKLLVIVASLRTTETEVGVFSAAARVSEIAAAIPIFMAAVAFPLLARAATDGDHARLANATRQVSEGLLVLMGAAVLVLVVAAKPLIALLAGGDFEDAVPVLQLQAFALLGGTVTQALIWSVIALRHERALIVTNLIGLAALVGFGVVLIGHHGAQGAAIAAVGGETVLAIATAFALNRMVHSAAPRTGVLVKLAITLALTVTIGLLLPIPPVLAAIIAAAIYGALALALGIVPRELLDQALALTGRSAPAR